ncbi:hypothetical protein CEXT_364281 [Caerostris extrusa]|uniref:Uncharacterized protein n=1 Tax=Caerostris extrusa TaxID=172846 RepID=A0AAV4X419_CAEEX|nr:hypothetical protein CEXT_364281 [Caerostris extrusa]
MRITLFPQDPSLFKITNEKEPRYSCSWNDVKWKEKAMTRRCRRVELSSIRAEDIAWGQGETLPNVLFIAILLSKAPFPEKETSLSMFIY